MDMDSAQAENYERLAEMLALKKLERRTRCKKLLRFCGSSNAEEAMNFWSLNFQFKGWESYSIRRSRTRTERVGDVCDVPAGGTRVHGSKWRSAIQVHASDTFFVNCETQQEMDELWEKLSDGGKKDRCRLAQR